MSQQVKMTSRTISGLRTAQIRGLSRFLPLLGLVFLEGHPPSPLKAKGYRSTVEPRSSGSLPPSSDERLDSIPLIIPIVQRA